MTYKLSNQAVGSLMLALQKGLMERIDITQMLKEFELSNTVDGLIVENPPVVEIKDEDSKDINA
jgi:hypothetical protein